MPLKRQINVERESVAVSTVTTRYGFDLIFLWRFRGPVFINGPSSIRDGKMRIAGKGRKPAEVISFARDLDGSVDWREVIGDPMREPREVASLDGATALGRRDGVTVTIRLRNQVIHVWELSRNCHSPAKLCVGSTQCIIGALHVMSCALEQRALEELVPSILTARETEVLKLCKNGHTYADAAAILRISTKTVEYHVANAMRKFGVKDRLAAILYAIREGLIEL